MAGRKNGAPPRDADRELREARAQQAATAAILKIIARSPTDVQPVFDAIARSVLRLLGTQFSAVQVMRDGQLHLAGFSGPGFEKLKEYFPQSVESETAGTLALKKRRVVQFAPIVGNRRAPKRSQMLARRFGYNSIVTVPMMRGGEAIGAIATARREARPFDEKQKDLLMAFADQAVIAIENARLFRELKASDGRYDIAMRAINEGVYDWDIANDKIFYSERVYQAVGLSRDDYTTAKGWRDRIHPEDLPRYDAALVAHFKRKTQRFECDVRYRTNDGKWHWARQHGIAMRDAKGRAVRLIGSTGNIDELKDVEQALKASEERYALATQAATEGIYDWNVETGDLYVSDHARRYWGFPAGPLKNRNWSERIHPEDFPAYRQAVIEHFKGRTPLLEHEMRVRNARGEYRWVIDRGIAVRGGQGRAIRLVGAENDITERKRAEQQLRESLEQQTATADVLKVIASSPSDVQPVFEAILRSATRLCSAERGIVFRYDAGEFQCVASQGLSDEARAEFISSRRRPTPQSGLGRMLATRRPVHLADITDDDAYRQGDPLRVRTVRLLGARTAMWLPLLKDDTVVGGLAIYRQEVRPFTEQQISLVQTFADQAVIAIENVRLFNETKESLERQTATAEILKVIASSPSDVQPVFDAVVQSAARLFGRRATMRLVESGGLRRRARSSGESGIPLPELIPIDRNTMVGTAVIDAVPMQMIDTQGPDASPDSRVHARERDYRASAAAPLLRDGTAIGIIAVSSPEPGALSDKQMELLATFADQAVIAIENVRLFNETREALERQTATAEILKVIASSPSDVQPVFDSIVKSALALCEGTYANVFRYDGDMLHFMATESLAPRGLEFLKAKYPMRPDTSQVSGRVILTKSVVRIEDSSRDADYDPRVIAGFWRRMLGVPMLREGTPLGVIVVAWGESGPILKHHEALLQTFADQAVIAIENVRLFNETKEALERQTATSEILRVISGSPTDTQPVFEAVAASAARLCEASDAFIQLRDGDSLRYVAHHGKIMVMPTGSVRRITRDFVSGRAILDGQQFHIQDYQAEKAEFPEGSVTAREHGYRTILATPLLREGSAIGTIVIRRSEARPFSEKQIELVKTFADQAVIAIENVRLFNETKEALERQTATSEILKVISSSTTDVQPVFEAIVQSGLKLFPKAGVVVVRPEDGEVKLEAIAHTDPEHAAKWKNHWHCPLSREYMHALAIIDRRVIDVPDATVHSDPSIAAGIQVFLVGENRAITIMPMLRGDAAIGAISVVRREPGALTDNQIALLRTFADQAVIAIENVRLFKELQAQTEALTRSVGQLTALGEVGQAISSTLELETVLQTIVSRAVPLAGLDGGSIYEYDERSESFELKAAENMEPELVAAVRKNSIRKGEGGAVGQCGVTLEPVQVPDILEADYQSVRKDLLIHAGYRAILAVPLLREDHLMGALLVNRRTPGPFAPEVVELLKTFATQSAMAIQNARLFREIAEKGKQLEVASQHKSQFLASMSHELRTPLNAILGFNEMVLDEVYGTLPADVRPPLENMQTSGKHLLRLINNVLDLAKIEAGRMELALGDYSVHDTVGSVHSTLKPLAAEKGLEFLATLPADLPLAYGDGGRIAQCLMNLAGNSLKFTKQGKVEISVAQESGRLRYSVVDTGIGIPPDKIASLFTEFKQTDATIASEYGGTGLGLSITKKFIEMHGGRIWVESEPGKGSTFLFEIPLRVST